MAFVQLFILRTKARLDLAHALDYCALPAFFSLIDLFQMTHQLLLPKGSLYWTKLPPSGARRT